MSAKGVSNHSAHPLRFLRTRWLKIIAAIAAAALLAAGLVRGLVIQTFTVPTASMEPTITAGAQVTVWRPDALGRRIDRGDVVVIDGRGSFIPGKPASLVQQAGWWFGVGPRNVFYAKRVIGVPGDRVSCCDADGYLTVNGERFQEDYLAVPVGTQGAAAGEAMRASAVDFDVEVPPARVFLLGDNRDDSTDSRNLLGRPGGGMIPEEQIVGVVIGHGSSVG